MVSNYLTLSVRAEHLDKLSTRLPKYARKELATLTAPSLATYIGNSLHQILLHLNNQAIVGGLDAVGRKEFRAFQIRRRAVVGEVRGVAPRAGLQQALVFQHLMVLDALLHGEMVGARRADAQWLIQRPRSRT